MNNIERRIETYHKERYKAEEKLVDYITQIVNFVSNRKRIDDFTEEQLAVTSVLIRRIDELFVFRKCKMKQAQLTWWNYEGSIDMSYAEIECMKPEKRELEGENYKNSIIKFLNIYLPLQNQFHELIIKNDKYGLLYEFERTIFGIFSIPIQNQIENITKEINSIQEEIQKYEIARKEIAGTRFKHDEFTELELELGKYINDNLKYIEQQKKLKEKKLEELKEILTTKQ